MPKASANKVSDGAAPRMEPLDTTGSTFAEAQQALEESLSQLQRDDLPLEDLPALYARAMAWESRCRQILSDVSQDLHQLDPDTLELMPWSEAQP
jgi:exodeoxyribonuclease VII small subunit